MLSKIQMEQGLNPEPMAVKSVETQAAFDMLTSGSHRYLDVRAPEAFAAGHVRGAVNVPYYIPDSKVKSLDFEQEVLSKFTKEDGIIVGCGTGNRSALAAADLVAAGFKEVKDMAGGYRAWLKNINPGMQQ